MFKSDNETLYEGLALLSDAAFSLDYYGETDMPAPFYSFAIDLALKGETFCEVFLKIYELVSALPSTSRNAAANRAWLTAYRIFRGCTNLSNNSSCYAMTKDKGYLEGYLIAREMTEPVRTAQ